MTPSKGQPGSHKSSKRCNEHHVKMGLADCVLDSLLFLKASGTRQIILIKQTDGEPGVCSITLFIRLATICNLFRTRKRAEARGN